MTLDINEFIRRFLLHVLPSGFHRIRHYGLFANPVRADNLIKARQLLRCEPPLLTANSDQRADDQTPPSTFVCPNCAAPMIVIQIYQHRHAPRGPPIYSHAS